jgi:hypothetical protein
MFSADSESDGESAGGSGMLCGLTRKSALGRPKTTSRSRPQAHIGDGASLRVERLHLGLQSLHHQLHHRERALDPSATIVDGEQWKSSRLQAKQ